MNKKVVWFLSRFSTYCINIILNLCIKKDNQKILFGLKPAPYSNDWFLHNTKYLFLELQNTHSSYKTLWLCDDKHMLKEFKAKGIKNVCTRKSIKGIWWILTAKYWVCDINANQITKFNASNTNVTLINFWHGAGGLKKVGYDADEQQLKFKKNDLQDRIYNLLKKTDNYYVVNSDFEGTCRKTAFGAQTTQLITLGSPRLDVLYRDVKHSEIFMENDFNKIVQFKKLGYKLFFYTPTFRDTQKDISGWLRQKKLYDFLKKNNIILVCKLHPHDENTLKGINSDSIYRMDNNSDVYPVLKYSDALITDYSSIYFDYLHLNKPIIYYIPDIKEYAEQCRGFYRPYETLTAGVYSKTEEELLSAMQDVINGVDKYKEKRKTLLDEMFVYQDGNNCNRAINFINGLEQ